LLYAPFSGVGGIVYDKDAVYIELGGSHSHKNNSKYNANNYKQNYTSNPLLSNIISTKKTIDDKLHAGKISLFSNGIDSIEMDVDENNNQDENQINLINKKRELKGKTVRFAAGSEESERSDEDEEGNEEIEDEIESESESENENEEDEEDEEDEESFFKGKNGFKFDDEEEEDEDEEVESEVKWKSNLKLKASLNFQNGNTKKTNWEKLIYGNQLNTNEFTKNEDNDLNDDNFFRVKKPAFAQDDSLKVDNSKYTTKMKDWSIAKRGLNSKRDHSDGEESMEEDESESEDEDNPYECIRDCFVTGKWDKSQDAEHLLRDDDDEDFDEDIFGGAGDEDEELYGDFEDFETGEVHKVDEDEDEESDESEGDETDENKKAEKQKKKLKSEMTKRERLMEKKKRIKEQFDREFDANKSKEDVNESAYYDHLDKMASEQSNLNKLEFEKMDDKLRVEYEGYRPGMYVRIEINKMPYEFVKNFDAHQLVIIGSLGINESNIGYAQVRLKKHRWHYKILKTKDPLIVSLGWRRFQTIPIYFIQDHNMRNRSLKYTPQHMYCHACFWGPITPQNTGFLAIQTMNNETVSIFFNENTYFNVIKRK
jgi:ribosome biogenesis protein BMS1